MPLGSADELGEDLLELRFVDRAGAVGVDIDRQRLGDADRVAELDRAARRARGDDVLRQIARHICRRAIDLGRILAAERAATVGGGATIGVDDDLAAGEAGVAVRPADLEQAGRVDVDLVSAGSQPSGITSAKRPSHSRAASPGLLALVESRRVLGRDDERGRADRLLVLVFERDLALGVGLEERCRARMAVGGHAFEDLVAVIERRGHQAGRLVGRVTEHDALVARALVLVAALVDAHRDMRRLAVEVVLRIERLPVEAVCS